MWSVTAYGYDTLFASTVFAEVVKLETLRGDDTELTSV